VLKSIEVALCATKNWAREKPELVWNDPTFCPSCVAKVVRGRSSPVFCPPMSLQTIARSQETGCSRMKNVRNAFCTFGPCQILTTFGSYSRARVYFARRGTTSLLALTVSIPVKWASPPNFTPRNFTDHFILGRAQHKENHSDQRSRRTKLHAAQNLPEAGATPSSDARCVSGPWGSLPPRHRVTVAVVWPRAYKEVSNSECGEERISNPGRRDAQCQF
jgi:hypothetical protein